MPAATNRCPRCGAEHPTDAPEGLCPACLARQVMTVDQPVRGGDDATNDLATTNLGGSLEPTVETISRSEPSDQTIDHGSSPGPRPADGGRDALFAATVTICLIGRLRQYGLG
jgi:hypothetical protein